VRLGCLGCLTTLILATVLLGGVWSAVQIVRAPEAPLIVAHSPADGVRAQQKIFDLLRRAEAGRAHTSTLSEQEVNAFLRRHVPEEDLPLRDLGVRLPGDGQAEITGRIALRQLLAVPPLSALVSVLPERVREHGVWMTVLARVTLETTDASRERRRVRLDVTRFRLGRLPLPEAALRLLMDPAALRWLRWPAPRAIDGIRIDAGHVTLEHRS
jgi:hypothetical protein